MFLMTQNRSKIINIDKCLSGVEVIGNHIVIRKSSFSKKKPKVEFIGTYETEERAKIALDSLSEAITLYYNNCNIVYKLPEK